MLNCVEGRVKSSRVRTVKTKLANNSITGLTTFFECFENRKSSVFPVLMHWPIREYVLSCRKERYQTFRGGKLDNQTLVNKIESLRGFWIALAIIKPGL